MSFIADIIDSFFGGKKSAPSPTVSAAVVQQAAANAEAAPVVDQEKIDAAARARKRVDRESLTVFPGLGGVDQGTGLGIPL